MSPARADLLVTALGLLLLLAWDASGLDIAAARLYGNAQGFAWREHWLTGGLLYSGGRWLAIALACALLLNVRWPWFSGLTRSERLRWLLVTLGCGLLVPLLKNVSQTSCPWDLAEFGGAAQAHHVSHWDFSAQDGGDGHCFPSGHAAVGAAFFSGWFALRQRHRRAARWWLAAACAGTLLMGWSQLARGAHYPSHTFWTAWLCWTLSLLAMRWPRWPRWPTPPTPPTRQRAAP